MRPDVPEGIFLQILIALNAPAFPESKFTMKAYRSFVLLAALLPGSLVAHADLASLIADAQVQAVPSRRTSIIFIQCHGLGYGDLSCYGQTNYQTPNLDRLAAEGMRFTSYHAGSTDFSTALAAVISGKSTADGKLAPSEITLAQQLQQAGYRTGLLGEWTLGSTPWTQGFDEFAGFINPEEGRNYYADYLWRYAPESILNETNNRLETYVGKEMLYPNLGGKQGQYLPDFFATMVVNFVHTHQPDPVNKYRPFFLFVSLPAPRSGNAQADDFPVPSDAPFTGEKWPQAAKNRAALITRLDNGIGRLFEELKKSKMTNNVAIFFTSASGSEKFADPRLKFLRADDAVDRGGPRVPMIVRWPGTVPAGRVSQLPWSAPDFAPTALKIAYAKPATSFTGISVLPVLLGQPGTNTPALPADHRLDLDPKAPQGQ